MYRWMPRSYPYTNLDNIKWFHYAFFNNWPYSTGRFEIVTKFCSLKINNKMKFFSRDPAYSIITILIILIQFATFTYGNLFSFFLFK